jgi:hypothetical protein
VHSLRLSAFAPNHRMIHAKIHFYKDVPSFGNSLKVGESTSDIERYLQEAKGNDDDYITVTNGFRSFVIPIDNIALVEQVVQ